MLAPGWDSAKFARMGMRRTGKRSASAAISAFVLAVLVGGFAGPAGAAEPAEPGASATMIELGVEAPTAQTDFDVIVTVQAVPPATGTPTGTVELTLDGASQGSATLGATGSATFTISVPEPGSYELAAAYSGDDAFEPSSSTSVFAADAPPDAGFGRPDRPLLPRGAADLPSTPAPAPASSALPQSATAEMPTELAFTGAFALPGLFLGVSSIAAGLACRRYARRRPA
jgi:hypothetical protein